MPSPLLELLTTSLGAALIKGVARAWLKDSPISSQLADEITDYSKKHADDFIIKRATERIFKDLEYAVGSRLDSVLEIEFPRLTPAEGKVVVREVASAFESVDLAAELTISDLDASRIHDRLIIEANSRFADLGGDAELAARLIFRESCSYAITLAQKLPNFQVAATRELLKRTTEILGHLEVALDGLERVRGLSHQYATETLKAFETDYRRALIRRLDKLQLFGVRAAGGGAREWPLSIAYVALSSSQMISSSSIFVPKAYPHIGAAHVTPLNPPLHSSTSVAQTSPVHAALAGKRRVVLTGEAGSGKTTLLSWLAVRAASRSFPPGLTEWNNLVPIFVRLREYASDRLFPSAKRLIESILPNTIDEPACAEWTTSILKDRALILIDGVDELPPSRRTKFSDWLSGLLEDYPTATIIVASRPTAIARNQTSRSIGDILASLNYEFLSLEPMEQRQTESLVRQWHKAIAIDAPDDETRLTLDSYCRAMYRVLQERPAVRALAANPLLCAMICALNWDKRQLLPNDRMELYRSAVEMLVDSRDEARAVRSPELEGLTREDKEELLEVIAYWMVRNGQSEASAEELGVQLSSKLPRFSIPNLRGMDVVQALAERSGVLRQPSHGTIDFIHRTFLEYFAARGAVNAGDLGFLASLGKTEVTRETVVFGAGYAKGKVREKLMETLLRRPTWMGRKNFELDLTILYCLETVRTNLRDDLLQDIYERARSKFPPKDRATAAALAPVARVHPEWLIFKTENISVSVAVMCILCAAIAGGDAMIPIIERYAAIDDFDIQHAILQAWPSFDEQYFVDRVLSNQPWTNIRSQLQVSFLTAEMLHCLELLSSGGLANRSDMASQLDRFARWQHLTVRHSTSASANRLSKIGSLRSLDLGPCGLSVLEAVADLPNLIRLKCCPFPEEINSAIERLARTRLETLEITFGNHEKDRRAVDHLVDLRPLADCLALRELKLSHMQANTIFLPDCTHVKSLSLVEIDISAIKNISALRELKLLTIFKKNHKQDALIDLRSLGNLMKLKIENSGADIILHGPSNIVDLEVINSHSFSALNISNFIALERIYINRVARFHNFDEWLKIPTLNTIIIEGADEAIISKASIESALRRGIVINFRDRV